MKIVIQPAYFELVSDEISVVCDARSAQKFDVEKLACALIREIAKQNGVSLPSRGGASTLLERVSQAVTEEQEE